MNDAEQPEVIRGRMLEVMRTLQRVPEGSHRDALDTYRHQLAALGRGNRAASNTSHLESSAYPRGPCRARQGQPSNSDTRLYPARVTSLLLTTGLHRSAVRRSAI